jgi:single-strand DNA-binding protein
MVANASLAVDFPDKKRDDTDKTDWFRLEVWGEDAERFADTLKKGQLIDVEGRAKSDSYVSKKTGETVNQWVIKVHTWTPVGTPPAAKPATTAGADAAAWNTNDTGPASDEEVPF